MSGDNIITINYYCELLYIPYALNDETRISL